ncbi:MAG: hypothetical protein LBO06_01355 [Bacteroidales bacterium]|jgi:hypothetical protein|nr:hypothetical protein [Bacteroidales bacterium]
MIKRVLTLFFAFCLIYPVIFRFLPGVAFRTVFGVIGAFVLIIFQRQQFVINNNILKILYTPLPVLVLAIVTNIVNGTAEMQFINLLYSFVLVVLAAYVVTSMIKSVHKRVDFDLISSYIIAAATLQCLLAAAMIIIPSLGTFMFEKLTITEYGNRILSVKDTRLMGVGGQSVSLGIINCFALLMIVDKLKDRHNIKTSFLLYLLFIFITVVGSMMARTTIIGTLIGLLLLLYFNRFQLQKYFRQIVSVLLFVALLYFVIIPSSTKKQFNGYFEYGFEMLYTLDREGELSTASTDELQGMLLIQPDNLKTWLIGDGHFENPLDKYRYYMETDVGYFRLIFYFGIFGCIAYFYYQYQILWQANLRTKRKHQIFFIFSIVLLFILSIKVLIEIISIFMMFLFSEDKTEDKKALEALDEKI